MNKKKEEGQNRVATAGQRGQQRQNKAEGNRLGHNCQRICELLAPFRAPSNLDLQNGAHNRPSTAINVIFIEEQKVDRQMGPNLLLDLHFRPINNLDSQFGA